MKASQLITTLIALSMFYAAESFACMTTVTSSDSTSCYNKCDGTATVIASAGLAPYTYQWDGFTGGQVTATATGLCPGKYFVTVTDASLCTQVDSAIVAAPDSIFSTKNITHVSCKNMSDGAATVDASGGAGSFTYNWQSGENGPSISNKPAGVYYVQITDGTGCTAVDSVKINEPPSLSFNLTFISLACNGDCNGYADVSVNGGTAPYNYLWLPAPGSGQGTPNAKQMCADSYKLYVTDQKGCNDSVPFTLNEPEPLVIDHSAIAESCEETCDGSAEVLASGGVQPYSYYWNNGSNELQLGDLCPGTYTVTVTDKNNCTITEEMNVEKGAKNPVADFYFTPEKTNVREPEVRFFQTSSEDVENWSWTFYDIDQTSVLQTDLSFSPIYEYGEKGGTFPVKLEVQNEAGCINELTQYVFIDEIYQLFVPDAFSPNLDGKNDVFIPVGKGIDENTYRMQVYNRWGQLIFTTTNPQEGWDGYNNDGTPALEGVYVWNITLTDKTASQTKHQYTGHVTLVN